MRVAIVYSPDAPRLCRNGGGGAILFGGSAAAGAKPGHRTGAGAQVRAFQRGKMMHPEAECPVSGFRVCEVASARRKRRRCKPGPDRPCRNGHRLAGRQLHSHFSRQPVRIPEMISGRDDRGLTMNLRDPRAGRLCILEGADRSVRPRVELA